MDVADFVEQMMLDLEVEPSQKPAKKRIAAGEIHGRLDLVNGPLGLHPRLAFQIDNRHRKLGFTEAVSQLEYHAEHDATHERSQCVEPDDGPEGMQKHGNDEGDREERDFPADEDSQIPTLGSWNAVTADAADG